MTRERCIIETCLICAGEAVHAFEMLRAIICAEPPELEA